MVLGWSTLNEHTMSDETTIIAAQLSNSPLCQSNYAIMWCKRLCTHWVYIDRVDRSSHVHRRACMSLRSSTEMQFHHRRGMELANHSPVIRSGEDSDQLSIRKELVASLHNLVSSADEIEIIHRQNLRDDICAKGV